MLATITTDLDKIAPRFEMQPDQIHIIQSPSEFYETLKVSLTIFNQTLWFICVLISTFNFLLSSTLPVVKD